MFQCSTWVSRQLILRRLSHLLHPAAGAAVVQLCAPPQHLLLHHPRHASRVRSKHTETHTHTHVNTHTYTYTHAPSTTNTQQKLIDITHTHTYTDVNTQTHTHDFMSNSPQSRTVSAQYSAPFGALLRQTRLFLGKCRRPHLIGQEHDRTSHVRADYVCELMFDTHTHADKHIDTDIHKLTHYVFCVRCTFVSTLRPSQPQPQDDINVFACSGVHYLHHVELPAPGHVVRLRRAAGTRRLYRDRGIGHFGRTLP